MHLYCPFDIFHYPHTIFLHCEFSSTALSYLDKRKKKRKMFDQVLAVGLFGLLYISRIRSVEITACNCSETTVVGALSLADLVHCEDAVELTPPTTVRYELFTNQRGAPEIRGIACRRVRNELILTGYIWYGSYAIDRRQQEEIVSPAECYIMKETLNCLKTK